MPDLKRKIPPAIKHGGYSALGVLPGEDQAAFNRLRRGLIAELAPNGALEDDLVETIARVTWRKQNLKTLRVARWAQSHLTSILHDTLSREFSGQTDTHPDSARLIGAAEDQARAELGDTYPLIEIGEAASYEGLLAELSLEDRLNGMIDRCIKCLLHVKALKSLAGPAISAPTPRLAGPSKAAQRLFSSTALAEGD